jgi:hypothetical protein
VSYSVKHSICVELQVGASPVVKDYSTKCQFLSFYLHLQDVGNRVTLMTQLLL